MDDGVAVDVVDSGIGQCRSAQRFRWPHWPVLGKLTPHDAALPILLAFSTNTITKAFLSVYAGGLRFALCVVPSLALVMLATWAARRLLLPS